jgi:hypothetical protein
VRLLSGQLENLGPHNSQTIQDDWQTVTGLTEGAVPREGYSPDCPLQRVSLTVLVSHNLLRDSERQWKVWNCFKKDCCLVLSFYDTCDKIHRARFVFWGYLDRALAVVTIALQACPNYFQRHTGIIAWSETLCLSTLHINLPHEWLLHVLRVWEVQGSYLVQDSGYLHVSLSSLPTGIYPDITGNCATETYLPVTRHSFPVHTACH